MFMSGITGKYLLSPLSLTEVSMILKRDSISNFFLSHRPFLQSIDVLQVYAVPVAFPLPIPMIMQVFLVTAACPISFASGILVSPQ